MRAFYQHEVYLQITRCKMIQPSCKRYTKSKSHPGMKLAPVRVFSCKHPLTSTEMRNLQKHECESHPSFIAVIRVSNSCFPAFRLSPKKVHKIKKFYFHNHMPTYLTGRWIVVGDSPQRTIGQVRIHTGFHRFTEIGRIFIKNKFKKKLFKLKLENVGLALPHIHYNMETEL